jgi:CheY-like chemotaxis protein
VSLDAVMHELRAVRRLQEETLTLLRAGAAASGPARRPSPPPEPQITLDPDNEPELERMAAPPATAIRTRRRKTVLLIDDDPATRDAAVAAFEHVEVPVKIALDGNEGLASIAQEKPDVIALELDMQGDMGGKDVINMIKATMDWVDIPIVLYTRAQVESQKEARTVHGADEYVIKGPQGADALVSRVIGIFRRG